jgi:hypothetical protein
MKSSRRRQRTAPHSTSPIRAATLPITAARVFSLKPAMYCVAMVSDKADDQS